MLMNTLRHPTAPTTKMYATPMSIVPRRDILDWNDVYHLLRGSQWEREEGLTLHRVAGSYTSEALAMSQVRHTTSLKLHTCKILWHHFTETERLSEREAVTQ